MGWWCLLEKPCLKRSNCDLRYNSVARGDLFVVTEQREGNQRGGRRTAQLWRWVMPAAFVCEACRANRTSTHVIVFYVKGGNPQINHINESLLGISRGEAGILVETGVVPRTLLVSAVPVVCPNNAQHTEKKNWP